MASDFSIQSVTDAGRTAIQVALDGGYPMVFSSIRTGSGIYTEGEDVTGMTALKSLKNSYPIGSKAEDANGITLGVVFTNYDGSQIIVEDDYRINEIGIFCTVNDIEYLYAVAAVPDGTGQEMPGYTGNNLTQIVQQWYVAYTNNLEIQVDMSGAYAPAQSLLNEISDRQQADFVNEYGLHQKSTTIATISGSKVITERNDTLGVSKVTTIENTSDTVKTITEIITPDEGDYKYTNVTVITTTASGKTITNTPTKSLKE